MNIKSYCNYHICVCVCVSQYSWYIRNCIIWNNSELQLQRNTKKSCFECFECLFKTLHHTTTTIREPGCDAASHAAPLFTLDAVESLLATADIYRDWYVTAKGRKKEKSRAHKKAQRSFGKPKHSPVVDLISQDSNVWFCAQHQWFDRFCSPLEGPQRAKSRVIDYAGHSYPAAA